MTEQNKTPNPMDHATARIITELAAALTAPLKEAVSSELGKAAESLTALTENMAGTLSSVQNSVSELSGELLSLSRTCETIRTELSQVNLSQASLPQPTDAPQNDAGQVDELLRSVDAGLSDLKAGLSDWKAVLKANGRAHTQELSDFSVEVSEQVGWMKSAIPGIVEGILEKALSSRAEEFMKASKENVKTLETRLTKFEKTGKMLIILGGVFLTLLGVLYLFK